MTIYCDDPALTDGVGGKITYTNDGEWRYQPVDYNLNDKVLNPHKAAIMVAEKLDDKYTFSPGCGWWSNDDDDSISTAYFRSLVYDMLILEYGPSFSRKDLKDIMWFLRIILLEEEEDE